jgi:ankyrin repeat protein
MSVSTALHEAAELSNVDAVHYLISQGADTRIKDAIGRTALDCVTISCHLEIRCFNRKWKCATLDNYSLPVCEVALLQPYLS